jgi:hypothetical protein
VENEAETVPDGILVPNWRRIPFRPVTNSSEPLHQLSKIFYLRQPLRRRGGILVSGIDNL